MEAAGQRVLSLADPALDVVEKALSDRDAAVRLKAAREVLEPVVPRHPTLQPTVNGGSDGAPVKAASEIIAERLAKLRADAEAQAEIIREPFALPGVIDGEWSTSDD